MAKMHKKIDRMRRQLAGESLGSGDDGEEVLYVCGVFVFFGVHVGMYFREYRASRPR